jgi:hypothetical protein
MGITVTVFGPSDLALFSSGFVLRCGGLASLLVGLVSLALLSRASALVFRVAARAGGSSAALVLPGG